MKEREGLLLLLLVAQSVCVKIVYNCGLALVYVLSDGRRSKTVNRTKTDYKSPVRYEMRAGERI